MNSKTFILKLFRYIVPVLFLFLCTTAVAQMDKDGNFHWDELYTPDEVLELDMSLPNKVEVSAIKNRERVKYVKLKCYPWIEHIPFTPETGEFVLKIENKYAEDYLIPPDKETDFVIFAFSNQEYEKILQAIQSINNAQSSFYLSMKEIEKYEKASSYNLQLTYINADNQVKNSTIQIENNDNKLTMLG